MICPICGKDYADGRRLHGHLMRSHEKEYRAAGFDKTKLKAKKNTENLPKNKRPIGFRLLKLSDKDEIEAYNSGYAFIDSEDNVYTHEEATEEEWI